MKGLSMKSHNTHRETNRKKSNRRSWLHCIILIGIFHKSDLVRCLIPAGGNPMWIQLLVQSMETPCTCVLLEFSLGPTALSVPG